MSDREQDASPSLSIESPDTVSPSVTDPRVADFLVEPTRKLSDWRWLWKRDVSFPIRSHRGFLGRLLVAWKRLLRPLVKVPQNDLWERQRIFNLILLEHLERQDAERERHHDRLAYLEELDAKGIRELMQHNDALFSRVDQKLDRVRRESRDLLASLGAALSVVETAEGTAPSDEPAVVVPTTPADLVRLRDEHAYLELERRYRGTEEEIGERISIYLPWLAERSPVLDLGCGRGESLALLRDKGIAGRGVDSSARMVDLCRERGLEAVEGDLFGHLAGLPEGSLGAIVSFHVIEHLPPESLDRLVRLAYRALRPGGALILETPNPLSLVVAARNFWLDPTHRRPVHPESLKLHFELAGFDPIERLDLRPFPASERLPEINLAEIPEAQHLLADRLNRLRDQIDELLFGTQDFGLIGIKPSGAGRP
ncbi:MAG TPA: class I SAM-dependent methyltransferase [Thermoanaerobaculia bacterium]|jgi:O-antigen chain-terminating methyltransferase|nr:class I SAM-dependent methyltransferase [Thermoanaerobaculia bacterium]